MIEPKQKRNDIVNYYPKWKSKTGKPVKVKLIDFKGFWSNAKNQKGQYYPTVANQAQHVDKNVLYIAEVWLCQILITGELKELKFVQQVPRIRTSRETSLTDNKYPVYNIFETNYLTDHIEECNLGHLSRNKYPNTNLNRNRLKSQIRCNSIRNLYFLEKDKNIKKGLFLLLRQKESPTISTFKTLLLWKKDNLQIYENIMKKVNESILDL